MYTTVYWYPARSKGTDELSAQKFRQSNGVNTSYTEQGKTETRLTNLVLSAIQALICGPCIKEASDRVASRSANLRKACRSSRYPCLVSTSTPNSASMPPLTLTSRSAIQDHLRDWIARRYPLIPGHGSKRFDNIALLYMYKIEPHCDVNITLAVWRRSSSSANPIQEG